MAFYRPYETDSLGCTDSTDCMEDLAEELAIIFAMMIFINNFLEIGLPFILKLFKKRSKTVAETLQSPPENQYILESYDSTVDDFDELAIQFGYVTLFVLACPLTPLLALLNNFVEIQIDANKLLKVTRRPEPRGAQDIGTWLPIFNIIALISIVTNIAIAVMYMDDINIWTDGSPFLKLVIAVCAEHVIIMFRMLIDYLIPDEPVDVTMHLARQQYILDVLIKGIEDDDYVKKIDSSKKPELEKIFFSRDQIEDSYYAANSIHLIN